MCGESYPVARVASQASDRAPDGEIPVPGRKTVATLENYREMAPTAWRDRMLSASMAYFTGPSTAPSPVSREALQLLG